jgi:hypothetical protein
MASLRQEAENYRPRETRNIADLPKVPVDIEVYEKEGMTTNEKGEQKTFKYDVIEIDNEEYRIPAIVKKQLKVHLETNAKLKYFKVHKSGAGLNTEYTVIPLGDDTPENTSGTQTTEEEVPAEFESLE